MNTPLSLALKLADEIEGFSLGRCGPSDDPDEQYAYSRAFYDLSMRFVSAVKRIGDPELSELVSNIDLEFSYHIADAHHLKANLQTVVDTLNELSSNPNYGKDIAISSVFLNKDLIIELKSIDIDRLDLSKLIKMCEELNDSYVRANYIACALLIRAVLNHVPPVFGKERFSDVVGQSGRSIKAILKRLNEDARPIADLHTHILMRRKESLPSKSQIEPYKAAFEVLIQEIIVQLTSEKV